MQHSNHLKRLALSIASQLPEDIEDALYVIALLGPIVGRLADDPIMGAVGAGVAAAIMPFAGGSGRLRVVREAAPADLPGPQDTANPA